MILIDGQGRISLVNPWVEQIFGYRRRGRGGSSDFYPRARSRWGRSGFRPWERFFRPPAPGPRGGSARARGRRAGTRPIRVGEPDPQDEGRDDPTSPSRKRVERFERARALVLATILDITQRKQAEEEVRESEARFRLVADAAPVLIWVAAPDKGCTWFNRPWLEFTGRPLERELGDGWNEGIHPEDLPRFLHVYNTYFAARRPFEILHRLRRHDGEYRWVLDHGVPRITVDGEFAGYIGAGLDVTDQRRAVEEVRASHERQRDLAWRLLRAQEVERRRLAREMHDDLTQRLAVMAIEIGKQEQQFNLPARVAEAAPRDAATS